MLGARPTVDPDGDWPPNRDGDSGGPDFRPEANSRVRAAGLIHGRATIDGVTSTCYTHISWLLAKSGSSLVLG